LPELSQADIERAREALAAGTAGMGIRLAAAQIDSFLAYLSLLVQWSDKFNLTAVKEADTIVRRHFLDSLAILPFVPPDGRLLDIGSGAGFPGLPLKLALPEKELVLVEPRRKKANFLREVIRRLSLDGAWVTEKRAEELSVDAMGLFSEVVTRALGSADLFLQSSFPLLLPGGRSMIMHGPQGRHLLPKLQKQSAIVGFASSRMEELRVPAGGGERCLLIFSKE
jgi:16S rRNA (guanine527-N7)-methyltransferase